MGWYFLVFVFVFGAGSGIASFIFIAAITVNSAKPATSRFSERYADLWRKVELSKKHFGQIANRESVGEARKIANIAIKKLNDGDR